MLLALGSVASAAPAKPSPPDRPPHMTEGGDIAPGGANQHGEPGGHLPGSSANVELIGELEPTEEFGPIVPGQIADLAVYKDFAYLNSWNEETCTKGGVYVVDIRDPRNPTEVDFIPAVPGNFHGEGADVITVQTKTFTGDLLAANNEKCTETERRRRLRPLRRHGPAQPEDARPGRG